MEQDGLDVLPYRTDAEGLLRWVEAVARAGGGERTRARGVSAKQWEGQVMTATALGLYDRGNERLTPAGEELALASEPDRRVLLERSMRAYPPYGALLDETSERRDSTDAQWIETWWATRGYGSSPSNRAEGAATFGRLAEFVGLGRYIPGRRGHPTRIEWTRGGGAAVGAAERAAARAPADASTLPAATDRPEPPDRGVHRVPPRPAPAAAPGAGGAAAAGYNDVSVALSGGLVARFVVPHRLPPEERRRLLTLLEALITEQGATED